MLTMVAGTLLYSAILLYNTEKNVLAIQFEANKKVLSQINYNITYMKEIVTTYAYSLKQDKDVVALLYNNNYKISDIYMKIEKLVNATATTSFLDSIMIYNGHQDLFYSSFYYPFDARLKPADNPLYSLLAEYLKNKNGQDVSNEWIPFSTNGSGLNDVFSFIVYEPTGADNKHSALIMNVKSRWLSDNLKIINDLANYHGITLVMDADGKILNSDAAQGIDIAELTGVLAEHGYENNKTDFFIDSTPQGKRIITYFTLDSGWKSMTIQPYEVVLKKVYDMRITSIVIAVIFLLLSVFVSIVISRKLYKPIEKLISQIGRPDRPEPGQMLEKDEITYALGIYKQVTEERNLMKKDYDAAQDPVKKYYLRKLVTSSPSLSPDELNSLIRRHNLNLRAGNPMIVGILKIDDFSKLEQNTTYPDRMLIYFAISNIAGEIISKKFSNETIDMGGDHLAVLITLSGAADDIYTELTGLMEEVQETILKFYHISITAALSPCIDHYKDITASYGLVQQYVLYRLVYGRKAVIVPSMVTERNESTELQLSPQFEKKIIESIHMNDTELFVELIDSMMNHVSKFSHDHMIYSVLHVVFIIKQTIKELDKYRHSAAPMDLGALNKNVLEQETLQDISEVLKTTITDFVEQQHHHPAAESNNKILVQTIKEMVDNNYADMNLCLQSIADSIGLSDKYTGRLFKKFESVGVAEYINEVRLMHAMQLLNNESLTVKEIMERVGIGSETQFFRAFKKKFGTPPGVYRNVGH